MTDMNANLNMLGAGSGAGAETGVGAGAAGGGGLLNSLTQNPELLAIVLDMIGSKMDPESPFAGTGTMLGKSSLAAKAEAGRQAESKRFTDMFGKLISSVTEKGQSGIDDLTISKAPGSKGYQYKLTGFEEEQKKMEEATKPTISTAEEFADKFQGGL